jgi:hypothetical protein
MFVDSKNISPSNFRVGQTIEDQKSRQYVIVDAEPGEKVHLCYLPRDERVKSEFLMGRLHA